MPVVIASVDPVSRIEGHMKIEVKVDTVNGVQQVVDAWATGTLFRGFEQILVNRAPDDAQHITERICGVCPVAHSTAAVLALDKACNVALPANGRLLRNLVNGANFLDSHILHFYLLALPDYIDGPAMPPWQPNWSIDRRFDSTTTQKLISHYVQAVVMRRKAHEAAALFGGRMPHPPAIMPGGITTTPRQARIDAFKAYLNQLVPFIRDTLIPDTDLVASTYSDYFSIGSGPGNLLAFGVFELDGAGNKLFPMGRAAAKSKTVQSVDIGQITEHVTYSWYSDSTNNQNPASGTTTPQYPKGNAYTWLKAPRYSGQPYECGPLSRMWVRGDYRHGVSVNDRLRARALEALRIAESMQSWIGQVTPSGSTITKYTVPASATANGLTEAPRGALGHWVQIVSSKISRYQVITPSCWNCSPRDSQSVRGPLEQALLGTPVQNPDKPVEVMRVIHSFDPCLDCAVHVMRPDEGTKVFALGHYHGGEDEPGHEHSHPHGHTHDHTHGH
jgi:hydrogenase large subunit